MGEALDHIERERLPWQTTPSMTECGRMANDVARIIARSEAVARWKRDGAARAAYTLCMTCVQTANRQATWTDSPSRAVNRYTAGYRPDPAIEQELRAVALVIDAHRDEYEATLAGLADAVVLADRRSTRGGSR